jgi:hypothetical protein
VNRHFGGNNHLSLQGLKSAEKEISVQQMARHILKMGAEHIS